MKTTPLRYLTALGLAAGIAVLVVPAASASTPISAPHQLVMLSGGSQWIQTAHTFTDPLLTEVIDLQGDPVPNVPVTFTIVPPSGTATGTAEFAGGAQNVTINTNAQGYAYTKSSTITADTVGDFSVQASTPGLPSLTFSETVTAPLPMAMWMKGDGQITDPNAAFAELATVKVVDTYGAGLANWPVNFELITGTYDTASASFPTGETVTVRTNAQGMAVSPVMTAGPTKGTVELIAQVGPDSLAAADLTVDPNWDGPVG